MKSRLEDPVERARLSRLFEKGLDETVGHVLPIKRTDDGKRWRTGKWFLRRERCYLVPGDSPLGLRLPLDSQPWVAREDYPYTHEPDPMQPPSALAHHAEIRRQLRGSDLRDGRPDAETKPLPQKSAAEITRTAICVEPRGGTLYVFMPPTGKLEDYLELVAAVEATAEALQQPVVVEGYEPPRDHA